MEKKYILTEETKDLFGITLHRIQAIRDFADVKAGDLGGWVESEGNLSHEGACWVYNEAWVYEYAKVIGGARVHGNAWVFGNAEVSGTAEVYDNAEVYGNARVNGNARVYESAGVYGNAWVFGNAKIFGTTDIFGDARVLGDVKVFGAATIFGNAKVYGRASISGDAKINGNAKIYTGEITSVKDYICIGPIGSRDDYTTFFKANGTIMVNCGCFKGDIQKFSHTVQTTHQPNSTKYAIDYNNAIALAISCLR